MKHPLEFVPQGSRRRLFLAFLFLTLILLAVFRVLDEPLRTDYAPGGIVSFELAGSPQNAAHILLTWSEEAALKAAFGLGIDYLFMPLYSFTLAFGALLTAGRHSGWLKSLGAAAGYGAFAAALFDAVENYALFKVLFGAFESPYPEIAFYCAVVKFGLLFFGIVVAILCGLLPGTR